MPLAAFFGASNAHFGGLYGQLGGDFPREILPMQRIGKMPDDNDSGAWLQKMLCGYLQGNLRLSGRNGVQAASTCRLRQGAIGLAEGRSDLAARPSLLAETRQCGSRTPVKTAARTR